jgi:hypothetical protein
MPPPLGFITPTERTLRQHDAHARAVAKMPRFTLPTTTVPKGTKVMLSDFWHKPELVAETGIDFDRAPFHQLTGSCVGAGGGNALYTLICVQRLLSQGATKAYIPWWPFSYGRSRLLMGDHGQGEGSMGSTFAQTIKEEGVIAATEGGLPQFQAKDGYELTERQEMEWSDGDSPPCVNYLDKAKERPVQEVIEVRSTDQLRDAALNGYPWTFACNNYIGNASVEGSGDDAALIGYWDGSGGHQQWGFGYWEHPNFGPLFATGNNWPRSTYAKDPAGLPMVCCWTREAKVASAMKNLDAEVYIVSHLKGTPAQPTLLDYLDFV